MAVRQVVIHECDVCGAQVRPAQLHRVTVQFDKFDACPPCTQAIRDTLRSRDWRTPRLEHDWSTKTTQEIYDSIVE